MPNYSTAAFSGSATFTPAAASHTNGDVNGGAQEFKLLDRNGQPPAPGSHLRIVTASLMINGATIETTAWTLYLYSATPGSAIADDAAIDLPSGDRASFLGTVAIAQVVDLGATLYIEGNPGKLMKLAAGSSSVFGYLVNGTTLTPQNVAHVVTLHCEAV
jgi:hypothetical protein